MEKLSFGTNETFRFLILWVFLLEIWTAGATLHADQYFTKVYWKSSEIERVIEPF